MSFNISAQLSSLTGGGSGSASAALDVVDTALSHVPSMLLVFPSPKVPVPVATIPCIFNPEKLRFSKTMNWIQTNTAKRNAPTATFNGGGSEKITIKLFLEHSYCGLLGVAGYIAILKMLVKKPPLLLDHPPLVMFVWGLTTSQMSYIESISYEYTMFSPGGKPLQAEVDLSLTEYNIEWLSLLPLNPTSRSEARKTWVVTEGQTLDWIAYQEYGDPAAWRHIASVNRLMNPMMLKPGQILKLTPLE